MKKIILISAILVIIAAIVIGAVAIINRDNSVSKQTLPSRDPFASRYALLSEGYNVRYTYRKSQLADYGVDGLTTVIHATGKRWDDYVMIYYFADKESASLAYGPMKESFDGAKTEHEANGMEHPFRIGIFENMIWKGSTSAIMTASKGYKGKPPISPNTDPSIAEENLYLEGFDTRLIEDEMTLSELGLDGLSSVVRGTMAWGSDDLELIYVFYFDSAKTVSEEWDDIEKVLTDFEESTISESITLTRGKYKNIVWIGTEVAIRFSSYDGHD